jgi:hypothetical protein
MSKKSSSSGTVIAGGLGAAALAAAAAAGYFFYGKDGKNNRQKLKTWSKSAKQDMVKKIKGLKVISKTAYEQAAKEVLAKYKQAKNIDPKELTAFGAELKQQWNNISKQALKLGTAKKKTPAKKAHKK